MRQVILTCAMLIPLSGLAQTVDPDTVALWLLENQQLEVLPGDDATDAIEMATREAIAVEMRLMDPSNYTGSRYTRDEIVLRERIQMPGLDPTNQYIDRHSLIKRYTLPSGRTVAARRTLNNEEIQQRRMAFGASNRALGDAFMTGAMGVALTGQVIDAQIVDSDFGNHPDFDGMEGSRLLWDMLESNNVQGGEQTNFMGDVVTDEDGNAVPVDYGKGCDVLANDDVEYSDTAAIGVSPVTRRFSISMFLAGPACMMRAIGERFHMASKAERGDPGETSSPRQIAQQLQESLGDSFVFHGYEGPANDRIAVIGITNLGLVEQLPEGGTLTINEMRRGIDEDAFVPRFMAMSGVLQQDGETRNVEWRTSWDDYRTVAGTALYEPHRQVVGFGGVLSEAEQAQMAEAQAQLAQFEEQLASMPPDQRAMVEGMLGPQMEQFRSMAQSGGAQFEMLTADITVNPVLMDPENSLAAIEGTDQQELIVKQIQKDLDLLGYDPGPMDGVLSPQTVAAIKAFETDHEMPVTGEATMELVEILTYKMLARSSR